MLLRSIISRPRISQRNGKYFWWKRSRTQIVNTYKELNSFLIETKLQLSNPTLSLLRNHNISATIQCYLKEVSKHFYKLIFSFQIGVTIICNISCWTFIRMSPKKVRMVGILIKTTAEMSHNNTKHLVFEYENKECSVF